MPFVIGPQVPIFDPDPEEELQVPGELPAFLFNIPKSDRGDRQETPLTQQTRQVSGSLAASILGRPTPTQVVQAPPTAPQAPGEEQPGPETRRCEAAGRR